MRMCNVTKVTFRKIWVENASHYSKDAIENANEDSDEGYFLEVDDHYPE